MIKVLSVNKVGNRIYNYTCTDGNSISQLTKEELALYIQNKMVINATKYISEGRLVIRVTDCATNTVSREGLGVNNRPVDLSKHKKKVVDLSRPVKKNNVVDLSRPVKKNNVVDLSRPVKKNNVVDLSNKDKLEMMIMQMKANSDPRLTVIRLDGGVECYMLNKSNMDHILYIPESVRSNNLNGTFRDMMMAIRGNLVVYVKAPLNSTKNMFAGCLLDRLEISEFNTSILLDTSQMFMGCGIRSMVLDKFNTKEVENMSNMFKNCRTDKLNLGVNALNTSNVKSMSGMFQNFEANELDLGRFDTSTVETMQEMFSGCKVPNLELKNFKFDSLKFAKGMFYGCQSRRVNLCNAFSNNLSNTSFMFAECNIRSVNISALTIRNVRDSYSMFRGCNIGELMLARYEDGRSKLLLETEYGKIGEIWIGTVRYNKNEGENQFNKYGRW